MKSLKIVLVLATSLALAAFAAPAGAAVATQQVADTDGIDTDGDGNTSNDYVHKHLTAGDGYVQMADGRRVYMFGFADFTGTPDDMIMHMAAVHAEAPAPTIRLREGQRFVLNLTNVGMMIRGDLFDPHTVHWHGYPNAASIFDGVPDASVSVLMGSTFTYFYTVPDPGTYIYHCHVEATEHMEMGMLGQLYVEARQNMAPDGASLKGFIHKAGQKYAYNDGDGSTRYDSDVAIQLAGFDPNFHEQSESVQPLDFAGLKDRYHLLNGRGYPDTIDPQPIANAYDGNLSQKVPAIVRAKAGDRVLLRLSSLSVTTVHTIRVVGIPMKVVGKDAKILRSAAGQDTGWWTQTITMGGGESYDAILFTDGVAPGTYFLHATDLNALSNYQQDFGGMMTEIVIEP